MFKYALILAFVPAFALAMDFAACKSGGPMPSSVEIVGCDTAICTIYNGVPVQMRGQMITTVPANELTTSLTAFLSIITLPLELPEDIVDGCRTLEGGCPVSEGEVRDLSAEFVVDSTFSDIKPDIELSFVNEDGKEFMCVRTTVDLQNQ